MYELKSRSSQFHQLDRREILEIVGPPSDTIGFKITDHILPAAQRFIAHSPFVCLASSSVEGADCSPRGDNPGFVRVLDQNTLALPDRSGNNLTDTFHNVIENPAVGLLFLIPGLRETLRVNGQGYITNDDRLLDRFSADERPAKLALVIEVDEVYFHCGKSVIRSGLWNTESYDELSASANLGTDIFSVVERIRRDSGFRPGARERVSVLTEG